MKPARTSTLQRDHPRTGPPFDLVSGPSFPLHIKVLATVLMVALVVFGTLAFVGQVQSQARTVAAGEWGFLLAVAAVIGSGYWGILTSRTSCDAECIEQTWLWRKKVNIADISQVKLIDLRGLSWLVVPRLVVRAGFGLTTFHAGDAAVRERFRLLAHGR